MTRQEVSRRAEQTRTIATPVPGTWRRVGLGALAVVGFLGLVSTVTCSSTTVPAGQNGISNGLCSYPRSCYLVNASGPNAGSCDDCSSNSRCRLVFTPDNPSDYQSLGGTWKPSAWKSAPTDWQAVCGLYPSPPAGQIAICGEQETVCVARGPACSGYCVRATGTPGGPSACMLGTPIPPQRRPGASGGATQTYCPLSDDVCCAAPAGPDGGTGDGGAGDGGVGDGGVTGDGGAAVDAAPVDQAAKG